MKDTEEEAAAECPDYVDVSAALAEAWTRDVARMRDAFKSASAGHFVRKLTDADIDELARIAVNTARGGRNSD